MPRAKAVLVACGVAAVVGVCAVAAIALFGGHGARPAADSERPPAARVVWSASYAGMSASARSAIAAALADAAPPLPATAALHVVGAKTRGDRGVVYAELRDRGIGNTAATEPGIALLVRGGGRWKALGAADEGFCDALQAAPSLLVSDAQKRYFLGCASSQGSAP